MMSQEISNSVSSHDNNNLKPAGETLMEMESGKPPGWPIERENNRLPDEPDASCFEFEQEIERNKTFKSILRKPEYSMDHKYRGCFLIFNQTEFSIKLKRRERAKDDYIKMEEMAKGLGFDFIKTFHNFTRDEIHEKLKKISKSSHTDCDCFGFAMLSHGGKDNGELIVYAKDDKMYIDELTQLFNATNCPTLALKPKLFFIQACSGSKTDSGAEVVYTPLSDVQSDASATMENDDNDDDAFTSVLIPSQADFLIAYSCARGFASWKTEGKGTWFVDALHKNVMEHGEKEIEIMHLLTKVTNSVCSYTTQDGFFMQVPCIMSQLCSLLYFRPKLKQINNGC